MSHNPSWQAHLHSSTQPSSEMLAQPERASLPTFTILCHPDPERIGEIAPLTGLLGGKPVALNRLEPLFSQPRSTPGQSSTPRPLADSRLSRRGLELTPRPGGAIRLDARTAKRIVLDGRELGGTHDLSSADLDHGAVFLLAGRVTLLLHHHQPATKQLPSYGLIGESSALLELRREIQRLVDLPYPVLLLGETGTGKELVARALHDGGPRRQAPYVSVNLAAVPTTLAAAELFGNTKGAFTGADQAREGHFQHAGSGTLFLDEIGEAPADVQVLLLRALETGQTLPLGSTTPQSFTARVVAATDVDLEAAIAAGEFRSPLFHRLAGYEIRLPPLRRRRDDLGRLLLFFLRQELTTVGEGSRLAEGSSAKPWLPAELVAQLAQHPWPGNVRELRNVARQIAVASRGEDALRLPPRLVGQLAPQEPPAQRPDEIADNALLAALRAERFHVARTAARLGISRGSLYNLMDRCPGVRKASELSSDEIAAIADACGGDLDAMAKRLEVSRRGLRLRMKENDPG